MLTQRLQRLPAILPFGALLLLAGRDIIVLVLGPAYRGAVEAYRRRQRQLERLRLLKLRKQALPNPFTLNLMKFSMCFGVYCFILKI
jgi:hypothetical protein